MHNNDTPTLRRASRTSFVGMALPIPPRYWPGPARLLGRARPLACPAAMLVPSVSHPPRRPAGMHGREGAWGCERLRNGTHVRKAPGGTRARAESRHVRLDSAKLALQAPCRKAGRDAQRERSDAGRHGAHGVRAASQRTHGAPGVGFPAARARVCTSPMCPDSRPRRTGRTTRRPRTARVLAGGHRTPDRIARRHGHRPSRSQFVQNWSPGVCFQRSDTPSTRCGRRPTSTIP